MQTTLETLWEQLLRWTWSMMISSLLEETWFRTSISMMLLRCITISERKRARKRTKLQRLERSRLSWPSFSWKDLTPTHCKIQWARSLWWWTTRQRKSWSTRALSQRTGNRWRASKSMRNTCLCWRVMPHLYSRVTSRRMRALSATILIPMDHQLLLDKTLSIVKLQFAHQRSLITSATTLINQTSRMASLIGLTSLKLSNTGWEHSRSSSKVHTLPESLTLVVTSKWLKTSSREELTPWLSIRNQWIRIRGTSLKW